MGEEVDKHLNKWGKSWKGLLSHSMKLSIDIDINLQIQVLEISLWWTYRF